MENNYTKEQLQEALNDFNNFIEMTKSLPNGTPIRLIIAKDLIKEKLNE